MTREEEALLVARANRGDAAALTALYRAHRDWVAALAYRFTGSAEDARDVAQETFLYLFGRFPLTLTVSLRGFLYPVVKHQAISTVRRRKPQAPLAEDFEWHGAAVSDFVMTVGKRRIRGIVRERAEATRLYREARQAGLVASLLTEERPNVFTQKIANIEPRKRIDVTLTYDNLLPWEDGAFTFAFPTVVGPRYNRCSCSTAREACPGCRSSPPSARSRRSSPASAHRTRSRSSGSRRRPPGSAPPRSRRRRTTSPAGSSTSPRSVARGAPR